MADFLTLMGIAIPIANDTFEEDPEVIGESTRASDGTYRKHERAYKRAWRAQAQVLDRSTREAFKRLIRGDGHHWSFDEDRYSDKGRAPTSTATTSVTSALTPKFGAKCLLLNAAGNVTWSNAYRSGGGWTVMVWRWNGASWDHWIRTSAGVQYKNGVSDATSLTWLSVSSGAVTLVSDGSTRYYDDLVVLSFAMPTAWGPTWGTRATAFPALPKLDAAGDAFEDASVDVMGELAATHHLQAVDDGAWSQQLGTFEFVLREV